MTYAALPRQVRKVGAPLAVIILLGTVAALLLVLLTAVNPVGTAIGFLLSTLAITMVLGCYLWLDRWEPEPPRLLVLAFLWGATVAVLLSIAAEAALDPSGLGGSATDESGTPAPNLLAMAVHAPFIEEAAKGLFLLIMMTGRRRNELNSMTDCLMYAGVTAAGFAWLEDILYIANGADLGESLVIAGMRLIMGPFAHPLFTTMTGIGVYFALQRRSPVARAGCVLVGYLAAVALHGMWNGSTILGFQAYLVVYVMWMVPVFALAVSLALVSRHREQAIVAGKLPGMVGAGLVSPNEATWLGSIRHRRAAVAEATRIGGRTAGRQVSDFAHRVVELAFVRDRIDRGFGDARVTALLQEEVDRLTATRITSPALQQIAPFRAV